MTKRLLIIPARKNSKRIKNKNFKFFFGKPIIDYSINLALNSKIFTKIHISTDAKNLKKKFVKSNIIDLDNQRPKRLSNHKTGLFEVFKYVVKHYQNKNIFFDEVWFLSSCSPLILKKDLIKASKIFEKTKSNTLLSTCRYSQPIERSFYKKNNKLFPILKRNQAKNTQFFSPKFYHTGNFAAFKKELFYKKNRKLSYIDYQLPILRSVDIDNIEDWKLAEKLFNS